MWLVVTVIMVVSLLTTACSLDENKQDNIAALVNGEPITIDDLHIWIDQREIGLEVQKKISRQSSESNINIPEELRADFEQFLMDMNITPTNLSEDQELFLKSQYINFRGVKENTDLSNDDEYRYLIRFYSNIVLLLTRVRL